MNKQLIYKELAHYYDIVYSMLPYQKEVVELRKIIRKYNKSKGKDLLEVACGTGNFLVPFSKEFQCTGVDLNDGMLRIAHKKLKGTGVELHRMDMTTLNLGKQFDVVMCLFSSIAYVQTDARLAQTIQRLAQHTKPGGVVIIDPFFPPEAFIDCNVHLDTLKRKDVILVRGGYSRKRGNHATIDYHYLILDRKRGTHHFLDRHELGLFKRVRIQKLMEKEGLKTMFIKKFEPFFRGRFVGVKSL